VVTNVLENVGNHLQDYTASQLRTPQSVSKGMVRTFGKNARKMNPEASLSV
jgi:hypothetical protein